MAPGKEDPKTIFSEQVLEELIQRHRRHQLYIHPYHQLSHELLLRKLKETHSLPEVVDSESHPLLKATPSVQTVSFLFYHYHCFFCSKCVVPSSLTLL